MALVVVAAACGGGGRTFDLSEAGQRGQVLTVQFGCVGCHGAPPAEAVLAPSWVDSWGETVQLDDGTTTVFDEQYVVTSLRDPEAQRPADAKAVHMPVFSPAQITDAQVEDIVTYISELGDGS